jgi:hypothetical protein
MVGVTVTDAIPIGVLRALTEGDLDGDWAAGAALVSGEATQGKASAVADKRIAKPLSQGLLTQGLVVK